MQCQNCNEREASKTFLVNWMGTRYQVSLCDECLERMHQYAGAMGHGELFKALSGWWPGKAAPRELGSTPFPEDAGAQMKLRVQLSALHARLEEAAQSENYEEAARLRDRLSAMQQEEYTHGS